MHISNGFSYDGGFHLLGLGMTAYLNEYASNSALAGIIERKFANPLNPDPLTEFKYIEAPVLSYTFPQRCNAILFYVLIISGSS